MSSSAPSILDCTITENQWRGLMCFGRDCSPSVTDCRITRNGDWGVFSSGKYWDTSSSPTFERCTISGNNGGVFCEERSGPRLTGCTITGNGRNGICCERDATAVVVNCTISGNRGDGIYCANLSTLMLLNAIVWGNDGLSISVDTDANPLAAFSCIESDPPWPGVGIISDDPLFCLPGQWHDSGTPEDPSDDVWITGDYGLFLDSPCIGTGQDGATMGADLGTCDSRPELFMRGDANSDAVRNIADAIYVLAHLFGQGEEPPCSDAADANDDGALNIADAIALLDHLFGDAASLPGPFPECGGDPTTDTLRCNDFAPCRR